MYRGFESLSLRQSSGDRFLRIFCLIQGGMQIMYQSKEAYSLDFSGINHISDIHRIIKDAFDFPGYYGMNWDACWDCSKT